MSKQVLTEEQARDIRERYATGVSQNRLAAAYGVSRATISNVVRGRAYPGAGGPVAAAQPTFAQRRTLTDEQARAIREEAEQGAVSLSELARRYGVSKACISTVVRGMVYRRAGGPLKPAPVSAAEVAALAARNAELEKRLEWLERSLRTLRNVEERLERLERSQRTLRNEMTVVAGAVF